MIITQRIFTLKMNMIFTLAPKRVEEKSKKLKLNIAHLTHNN